MIRSNSQASCRKGVPWAEIFGKEFGTLPAKYKSIQRQVSESIIDTVYDVNSGKQNSQEHNEESHLEVVHKSDFQAPLCCHPLPLTGVSVDFTLLPKDCAVEAAATAKITGKTGVEMEALTAVSTALLTIYDMCKAIDKGMEITDIHLEEKSGGKSGHYQRA